jgi:hypothetical protein
MIKRAFAMNRRQMILMWLGILALVGVCLYPPWVGRTRDGVLIEYVGHSWITRAPDSRYAVKSIDFGRLGIQWGMVVVITIGLMLTFRDKKDPQKAGPPRYSTY